jgi:hypothetical protein
MKRITLLVLMTVGVSAIPRPSLHAQDATLDEVLARATTHALDYQKALSGVVSEARRGR